MAGQAESMAAALPQDYYWSNFNLMLAYAFERYRDFFSPQEMESIAGFQALPKQAQALFIRLYNRKGQLFRESTLAYDEIQELPRWCALLCEHGYLSRDMSEVDTEQMLAHLKVAHLRGLVPEQRGKKSDLLAACAQALATDRGPLERLARWLWVVEKPLFQRLMVLFFCNRFQAMSDFVKVDLGHVRYESYPVDAKVRYFESREHLEQYLLWGARKDAFYELCQNRDWPEMAATHHELRKQWPANKPWNRAAYKMMFAACKAFEHGADWDRAIEAYSYLLTLREHFPCASRYVHCLEKTHAWPDALSACNKRLMDNPTPSQRLFFEFHRKKAEKALGLPQSEATPMRKPAVQKIAAEKTDSYRGAKATYAGQDGQNLTVEDVVLAHYAELGWQGLFAENGYMGTLAAMLCWDLIFAPLPGVFQTPYQHGPLDFYSRSFFTDREQLFARRLAQIAAMDSQTLTAEFKQTYREKQGVICGLGNTSVFEPAHFEGLLRLTEPAKVSALLQRYFAYWPETRRGFPDLCLWNQSELMFVEVKGDGDQVFEAQRVWHDLLLEQGFRVVLLRVCSRVRPACGGDGVK